MMCTIKHARQPRRSPKGRFWHFIQRFWSHHGGTGYDDEWVSYPGEFYANLSNKSCYFKTIFPYHLELSRINSKTYSLSIEVNFNSNQRAYVERNLKVKSKKEAIKKTLKVIKNFENSERFKETWKNLITDIPIVNSDSIWVASVIIGSVSSFLCRRFLCCPNWQVTHPLGFGVFYSIDKSRNSWYWTKYDINSCGYIGSSCSEVSFQTWQAIFGYNESIDVEIKKAIKYSKLNLKSNQKNNIEKAEFFMQCFYDSKIEEL